MTTNGFKLPLQAAMDRAMSMIQRESHANDAVIIVIDEATSEFKVKTMRGDGTRLHHLLQITLQALERQKGFGKKSSIILPN